MNPLLSRSATLAAASLAWAATSATAQVAPLPAPSWQTCSATADGPARLACFDRWAQEQALAGTVPAAAAPPAATAVAAQGAAAATPPDKAPGLGCQDNRYSRLSRFWELDRGADCGTFELRGYRPISMSVVASNGVNRQPSSPAPGHTALTTENYRDTETRIQLSARIKVAKDVLTHAGDARSDSLWVGFTQQSYWQFFSGGLSRPFRTTDYEPEAVYVYPFDTALPGGWRLRHGGVGLSHQSNGRELPLSRSWNRAYLMGGLELDDRFSLEARAWQRMAERHNNDDNPDISDYIGRGELTATWHAGTANTFAGTVRHSLRSNSRGSVRLDYFRALGKGTRAGNLNDLRLHVQLFSGYGDSLLDYNRRRTVLSLGLALVDW